MLPVHDTTGVVAAIDAGGYAELSRLVSCTSLDGVVSYAYDPTGQLIAATYTGEQSDESYTYDANGNRTDYIIGPDNRLLSDGTYRYGYDKEGNRTARFIDVNANAILDSGDTNITEYQWDARNRLTKVTDYETYGGSATQIVDYLYDLENRWIGKRVDSDGDGTFDSQEGYVYDGNQMVLRFEDDDLSNRYLWQPDAVDQLMADEQIETDEVVLALTDHLGTVRDLAVMDGQSGETSVVNHITYDSYGQKLSETNAAVDCLFGFTGRAFDDDTGLQNNLNRWYDSKVGRWMSKDPIGFNGKDVNTYRYVGNGVTTRTDPSGNAWYDYINPYYWFSVDWHEAVDQEITVVKALNETFGTNHLRLEAFTPSERARIEAALGITIDWENGAIKVSTEELKIRRNVLGTSEGFLWTAGAADAAAGGLVTLELAGVTTVGSTPLWGAGATTGALGIGSKAINPMGLGAGTWPAILVNGQVYIARMHEVAWRAAGQQDIQKYGYVIIDAAGKVLKWAYE